MLLITGCHDNAAGHKACHVYLTLKDSTRTGALYDVSYLARQEMDGQGDSVLLVKHGAGRPTTGKTAHSLGMRPNGSTFTHTFTSEIKREVSGCFLVYRIRSLAQNKAQCLATVTQMKMNSI